MFLVARTDRRKVASLQAPPAAGRSSAKVIAVSIVHPASQMDAAAQPQADATPPPFLGDDIFVLIATELDARMLGRLGCAAQRFWRTATCTGAWEGSLLSVRPHSATKMHHLQPPSQGATRRGTHPPQLPAQPRKCCTHPPRRNAIGPCVRFADMRACTGTTDDGTNCVAHFGAC